MSENATELDCTSSQIHVVYSIVKGIDLWNKISKKYFFGVGRYPISIYFFAEVWKNVI